MEKIRKIDSRNARGKKFYSQFSIVLGIFILVFISVSLAKEIVRRYEVSREISALKSEIQRLESRNTELNQLISFFSTEEFLEQEARTRLNLQKIGEKVMIIPDVRKLGEEEIKSNLELSLSNPARWWNYFFAEQ